MASAVESTLKTKAQTSNLSFYYGAIQALKNIHLTLAEYRVTALIGPSGCGKTTYLRCFNRMHDLYPGNRYEGQIVLYPDEVNIVGPEVDPIEVRMRVSMVFQKPNPFPKSVYENVAYGLRVRGVRNRAELDEKVEVPSGRRPCGKKPKTASIASLLTFRGQQQRLCIARALASEPEIILFDEPTSALDPLATLKIEELMGQLKQSVTILIVTHNMQQAARISDFTAFMYLGEVIESGQTNQMFDHPTNPLTEQYVSGASGNI